MTNRDRDALAKQLTELAERLSDAPAKIMLRATEHAETAPSLRDLVISTYRIAGLEHACQDEATAIRRLVEYYLVPRPSKVRGRR